MEANLALDASFLIDFEREIRRGRGPARSLLNNYADAELWVPATAWGEFIEGEAAPYLSEIAFIRGAIKILPVHEGVAKVYADIVRVLRPKGNLIGANDLWIAATALEKSFALVTKNKREFSRVSGLRVIGY